jgi:hypothetical protein
MPAAAIRIGTSTSASSNIRPRKRGRLRPNDPITGEDLAMHRSLIATIVALPLVACSQGPTVVATNSSTADVANQLEASGATVNMMPGRWEGTVTIAKMDMPGMPAAQRGVMMDQIGKPTKFVSCLKPEDIQNKHGLFKGIDDDKSCKYSRFAMNAGKIDAALSCTPRGMQSTTTIAGTFSGDTMHMDVTSDTKMAQMPAGNVSMQMAMDSKRVGECRGTEDKE